MSAPQELGASKRELPATIVSRPYPRGIHTNATGPLGPFFGVSVVDDLPEEVAASLRPYFGGTYQRGAS